MAMSTFRSSKIIGAAAAGALAISVASAGAAGAVSDPKGLRANDSADPVESICTIDGYAPNRITLGASTVRTTFAPKVSECTLDQWFVFVGPFTTDDPLDTSGIAGNFVLDTDGNGNPASLPLSPTISLDPHALLNAYAGKHKFVAVNARGVEDPPDAIWAGGQETNLNLTLQRRSTFGSTFNASPEPVKKGKKISIKATLTRVNWTGAKHLHYVGFANQATLQFKEAGTTRYVNVKTVTSNTKGKISTTVAAKKSGRWRLYFPGLSTTASTTSASDTVKVK
jgi:hypothetical protein